ncbi:MAG: DNA replication/repair protein RecF [Bacteroidales bacterium]|nr:DNA replication/repair protein RecF [Bacteroidales bacterium]
MILERLQLTNFKNYREADVELCGGINCFVGNNGAGKTNLLDAVYYLSFCKSYFSSLDSQNILIGEDFFAVHGHYIDEEQTRQKVSCIYRRVQGKQMRWMDKVCKTLAEHIGRLPLVMVSPLDQSLITGDSVVRRKFLDGVISQAVPGYLDNLIHYTKAVEQRNRLLKQMFDDRQWDESQVSLWDEQLVRFGTPIYDTRERFIEQFCPIFAQFYQSIAGTDEIPDIVYEHSTQPLGEQLAASRQADKYQQYTTVGPHKDDLVFLLNANYTTTPLQVKRYGSQGQQKSFALALKMAQFQYLNDSLGRKPILLLDDIFDKLDMERVHRLIEMVGSDRFGQVLLTDTQPGRVEAIFEELPQLQHKLFNVRNGELGR